MSQRKRWSEHTAAEKRQVVGGTVLLVLVGWAGCKACGSCSGQPADQAVPRQQSEQAQSAEYKVTKDESLATLKRSVDVELPGPISAAELRAVAEHIHSTSPRRYDRTFIEYRLAGVDLCMAWATTHYNPGLDVRILVPEDQIAKQASNCKATHSQIEAGHVAMEAHAEAIPRRLRSIAGARWIRKELTIEAQVDRRALPAALRRTLDKGRLDAFATRLCPQSDESAYVRLVDAERPAAVLAYVVCPVGTERPPEKKTGRRGRGEGRSRPGRIERSPDGTMKLVMPGRRLSSEE